MLKGATRGTAPADSINGTAIVIAYGTQMVISLNTDDQTTATCTLMELSMKSLVARFVKNESGATAIEYGLIAAGISVAIIATVQGLGTNLRTTFTTVSTALK
jgi:pilus assembly protein Flp/PilA